MILSILIWPSTTLAALETSSMNGQHLCHQFLQHELELFSELSQNSCGSSAILKRSTLQVS